MSLLSKTEVQYLQGQKVVSKSYEYKLRSIIKKKVATLLDQELPLISSLFPNLNLTKNSKERSPLKATIPGSNPGRSIPSFNSFNKQDITIDKLSDTSHKNKNIEIRDKISIHKPVINMKQLY